MGQSTNGQICFGVLLGEEGDIEIPWRDEAGEVDFDDWWIEVACGFKPTKYPYNEAGDYLPGMHEHHPDVRAYYDERHAFKEANPCPVELVNYCSGDSPMYILAVVGSTITAHRGDPTQLDPDTAFSIDDGAASLLIAFCEKHGIEFEGEPAWWLSSYWG